MSSDTVNDGHFTWANTVIEYQFPLQTTGQGVVRDRRFQPPYRSMGSAAPARPYNVGNLLFMRSRRERPLPMYNVPQKELDQVPEQAKMVRAIRVA